MIKFVDEAIIYVRSGKGGDGCVAFRRERGIPKGGPWGGDGGKGGDVIFKAVRNKKTLIDFHFQKHFYAENGKPGSSNNKKGKDGKNLIIYVPCGTIIKEIINGQEKILGDLIEDGMSIVVAKGGKGGLGNTHFKSSTNQTPKIATKGELGEEKTIKLELKIIADVGIIGYPNSGKSTLLSKISKARPKIADYPFTTIEPNLGLVDLGDYRSFVAADIPGLIEGASKGKGLGIKFLKHIERTKILIHLLDLSENDIINKYENIRKELENYSPTLVRKKEIVVGNKIDLEQSKKNIERAKNYFKEIYFISALTGTGIKELLEKIWEELKND
ncbi:MAG: GTPase ObgE [Candidatus Omnitrophica bacterium]|nr:GTPase ObgE [Candidatus Omnitrophota bacterium]MCM8811003.1 GTPase ObgE [Candidatus Omnitrophota bacterium]